jgi:hypothetical protein
LILDGAYIEYDPDENGSSGDYINVTGQISLISSPSFIYLVSFNEGLFKVAGAGQALNESDLSTYLQNVYLDGTALNTSLYNSLIYSSDNKKEVWLQLSAAAGTSAQEMTWTGTYGDTWDGANWYDGTDDGETFSNLDYATFSGTVSNNDITLTGTVHTSGVKIENGTFRFSGGSILGSKSSDISFSTGKLELNNHSKLELASDINFSHGVEIDTTSELVLLDGGSLNESMTVNINYIT